MPVEDNGVMLAALPAVAEARSLRLAPLASLHLGGHVGGARTDPAAHARASHGSPIVAPRQECVCHTAPVLGTEAGRASSSRRYRRQASAAMAADFPSASPSS